MDQSSDASSTTAPWMEERTLSTPELLALVSRPRSPVSLLATIQTINYVARQIELEGVPSFSDWACLAYPDDRAAVLVTLRARMAMRSLVHQVN